MPASGMRVALVQDGAEATRLSIADVFEFVRRTCDAVGPGLELTAYADERVEPLLRGDVDDDVACIVLASNALRSSAVAAAARRHRDELRRFVARGGGLVVLHQYVTDLTPYVPWIGNARVHVRELEHAPLATLAPAGSAAGDVLLRYPSAVDLSRIVEIDDPPKRVYWRHFTWPTPATALQPVAVGSGGEVVIARSTDASSGRVVLSAAPLDWLRAAELLGNALSFALNGSPERMALTVLRDDDPLAASWLADGGATAFVDSLDAAPAAWLGDHVSLVVLDTLAAVEAAAGHAVGRAVLARGGAIVGVEAIGVDGHTHARAVVGDRLRSDLARRLVVHLRGHESWVTHDNPYEMRSILRATEFFDAELRAPDARYAADAGRLRETLEFRLRQTLDEADLPPALATLECLNRLGRDVAAEADAVLNGLRSRRAEFGAATVFEAEALAARAGGRPLQGLGTVLDDAAANGISIAGLAKVLGALALAGSSAPDLPRAELERAATVAVDVLDDARGTSVAWPSVEASSAIARGLLALRAGIASDPARAGIERHLAEAYARLQPARAAGVTDVAALARFACAAEAAVAIEEALPIRLRQLSLVEWPRPGADRPLPPAEREARRRLVVELARLRRDELAPLREDVERLRADARAARFGRGVATGVAGLVLAAVAVLVVRLAFDRERHAALEEWLTLLSLGIFALAALAVVAAAALTRLGLLARPAVGPVSSLRRWVRRHVPFFGEAD